MHQIIPVIDVEFERDDGFLFRPIAQELLRRRTGIAALRREKLNTTAPLRSPAFAAGAAAMADIVSARAAAGRMRICFIRLI